MEILAISRRADDRVAHSLASFFIIYMVSEGMANIVGESTNTTLGFCSNFSRKFLLIRIY